MSKNEEVQVTRSVLKALDVLECLHDNGPSLSPSEIAQKVGISRPTAYRLLATMATRGWVVKDPQNNGDYQIGYRVLQMAGSLLKDIDIRKVARPHMEDLSRRYDESVTLWVRDDVEIVYLDRVYSTRPIQSFLSLGARGCMHSKAAGKAILARLTEGELERTVRVCGLMPRTNRTIVDYDQLQIELEKVQRLGYGTADNEDVDGLRAVGAAILDFQGRPIGGMAVSGLLPHMSDSRMALLGDALAETAAQVSAQLGYVAESQNQILGARA